MTSKQAALGALWAVGTIALSTYLLSTPSAHADVPFAAGGTKDASSELKFDVTSTKTYFFYLNLHYINGNRQDQERVSQLVDSWARRNGQPVRSGLPIPLHLTVTRTENEQSVVILDGQFARQKLEGHGDDHFSNIIAFQSLQPGRYHARIVELDDVPALQSVHVSFDVHVPGNPK